MLQEMVELVDQMKREIHQLKHRNYHVETSARTLWNHMDSLAWAYNRGRGIVQIHELNCPCTVDKTAHCSRRIVIF